MKEIKTARINKYAVIAKIKEGKKKLHDNMKAEYKDMLNRKKQEDAV